ncbi:MAG: hypothetical protein ACLGIN_09675, partial [Candidatus Sericytochromatia bacterium]
MTINEANRGTGRLDPSMLRQPTGPLTPPPAEQATPQQAPAGAALPTDGVDLTSAAQQLPDVPEVSLESIRLGDLAGAAKEGFDELKDAVTSMNYRQVMGAAANTMAALKGVDTVSGAVQDLRQGNYVDGSIDLVRGSADAMSGGLKLHDIVMGNKRFSGAAADLKGVSSFARGVSGTLGGVQEIRDGNYLAGGTQLAIGAMGMTSGAASIAAGRTLAAAAQTGRQMGLAGDALEAFKRQQLRGSFGGVAAPLAVGATALNGAFDVAEGIQAMRNGQVLDGALQAGQGALDAAASASHVASVLPTASRAVAAFGKAAGPLGAAAGVVGGGMQAYEALSGDPPDYRGAALGGAKAAGSALLLTPPPGNIAGGTILIGAALYENVTPVREVVDGAVGGVVDVAEGVGEGAAEVAEGVTEAAAELSEGYRDVRRE